MSSTDLDAVPFAIRYAVAHYAMSSTDLDAVPFAIRYAVAHTLVCHSCLRCHHILLAAVRKLNQRDNRSRSKTGPEDIQFAMQIPLLHAIVFNTADVVWSCARLFGDLTSSWISVFTGWPLSLKYLGTYLACHSFQ